MKFLRILTLLGCLAGVQLLLAQTAQTPGANEPPPVSMPTVPVKDSALLGNLPPTHQGKPTLLGGTIDSVDRVRDVLVLQTFGAGKMKIIFDDRTSVYLDRQTLGHQRDLRKGQRVHLDVTLISTKVFAQSIYVLDQLPTIESSGQVVSYKASSAELTMRDSALDTNVKVHLLPATVVVHHDQAISVTDIPPGSLISVVFRPESDGRVVASRISIVAQAGETFTFSGRVAHMDLRIQLVVLQNVHDLKTYEIYFDPANPHGVDGLREGVDATIAARFDGTRYVAGSMTVAP